MHSGLRFDLADPTPEMVTIDDICWALAHTLRYGGHAFVPINVAAHSINVMTLAAPEENRQVRLLALLHDAHEAYLGDVIRPLKALLGEAWMTIERRVDAVIAERFGVKPEDFSLPVVKRADMLAYSWERRDLVGIRARDETMQEYVPFDTCPNPQGEDAARKMREHLFDLTGEKP